MTSEEFGRCIHPREWSRLLLALLFAVPVTIVLLVGIYLTLGMLLAGVLLLAFVAWLGFEVFYASLLGNWILVSEDNYPRLHELLKEMKERIGVSKKIDIIVYDQSHFSAYFSLLFARRAIFIGSELLAQGVTDDELRWIIGRFVGWIRAKRRLGPLRYVIALAERLLIFNLFIYPYERATIYSGDRVGLAAISGDISSAVSTMNKLMVGREMGYSVNPAGVVRQHRRVKGSLFAFLARLLWPLPHMTARYVDLIAYAERNYDDQYEQFAAMNPSFQTSGGTMRLMWSTEKEGDAGSNAIGALLLAGAFTTAIASYGIITNGGIGALLNNDFLGSTTASTETTEPAAAHAAYALEQLSPEVATHVEQARQARTRAEQEAEDARAAAEQAQTIGSDTPYEGYGFRTYDGEYAGDRFAGRFSGGRHDLGVYSFANNANSSGSSTTYEGRWRDGRRSGYGVYTWTSSQRYLGHWSSGSMSGHGVMELASGRRYEGEWSEGKRHGYGVEWDASGAPRRVGVWAAGALQTEPPPTTP